MKTIILSLLILISSLYSYGQEGQTYTQTEEAAISTVEAQLAAYNEQNLEAFLKFFSPSIKVFDYPGKRRTDGIDELRVTFEEFFKNAPNLNSEITNRMVLGNRVIDYEKVTGYSQNEKDVLNVIAIYTVESKLITEIRFLYPE